MNRILLLYLFLSISNFIYGQIKVSSDVSINKDIIYNIVEEDTLKLDIYWHKNAKKPEPLVIWIHGGGWRKGSKNNPRAAVKLLDHGYAVASIDYRLSDQAVFPAQILDCKAAIRWLKAKSSKYNIDSTRMAVWGASAGGHLSALVGTSWHVTHWDSLGAFQHVSSKVQAVCDWYGPTDLLRMDDRPGKFIHNSADSPEGKLIGGPIQELKAKAEKANPINYIQYNCPPFLIMHGKLDDLVIWEQSQLLHDALLKNNQPSTLLLYDDLKHGGKGWESQVKNVLKFFNSQFFE